MATNVTTPIVGVTVRDGVSVGEFTPGAEVQSANGGILVYVSATSTIAVGDAVVIDNLGGAVPVTTTNSATSKRIAVSAVSIASSYFGWVQVGGKLVVKLAANCAPNVPLYTTATAGVLDDAVVSTGLVIGLVANTSISNATAVTCVGAVGMVIASGDMD